MEGSLGHNYYCEGGQGFRLWEALTLQFFGQKGTIGVALSIMALTRWLIQPPVQCRGPSYNTLGRWTSRKCPSNLRPPGGQYSQCGGSHHSKFFPEFSQHPAPWSFCSLFLVLPPGVTQDGSGPTSPVTDMTVLHSHTSPRC